MKKFLFVLLATTIATPALAQNWDYATQGSNYNQRYQQPAYNRGYQQPTYNQDYQQPVQRTRQPVAQTQRQPATQKQNHYTQQAGEYKLNNPMYRPTEGTFVLGAAATYGRVPKNDTIGQPSASEYGVEPNVSFGLTDKLSINVSGRYAREEVKYPGNIKRKISLYGAEANLRYLIASVDDFDFNIKAGIHYNRSKVASASTANRRTGTDYGLQIGKKIENVTPYFEVGFASDFWSKRGNSTGTSTYINPGIYIDLAEQVGLDLNYRSVVHGEAIYKATLDFYPAENFVLGIGGFIVHPETDTNEYGGIANFKVAF